jgi:hypothetical protein
VRPTVQSAVLPAVTPERATDFFGLKDAMGVLVMARFADGSSCVRNLRSGQCV